jgi:hypothetical protein
MESNNHTHGWAMMTMIVLHCLGLPLVVQVSSKTDNYLRNAYKWDKCFDKTVGERI